LHGGFSGVTDTAYEIQFEHSGSEDLGIATFNFSVNASWVEGYGGRDNIWVIRISGETSEVLLANFTVHDPTTNRDFFSVESPRGMSRFSLSKLFGSGNPFQLLMYKLISIFSTPVDTSGGDWPTVTPTPRITPRYNPPPEIPTIIVTPGPTGRSGNLPVDMGGTVIRTITIQSADGLVQVDFPTGTRVSDASGYPVDEVSLIGPFVPSLPPVQYIAGSMDTGIFYSISPNGTTYNPPVTVTLTIPQMQWDSSMEYHVWQYDGLTEQWIELPSTLSPNDRTISFQVSKSGIVTVMKNAPPRSPMADRDSTGPKGAMQPGSDQVSIFSGMIVWLGEQLARYFSIAIIGITVVCLAVLFFRRRRYYP
jgi:hypothetical protein